jgi:hypothetical protein
MSKMIRIKKGADRVEIRENGTLICDVQIADSSKTSNVNLSFKIPSKEVRVSKVPQAAS